MNSLTDSVVPVVVTPLHLNWVGAEGGRAGGGGFKSPFFFFLPRNTGNYETRAMWFLLF